MSTRSRIEIDGINLYSHYDGYREGMATKLFNTIKHSNKDEYADDRFINSFISANQYNCELDINKEIGGLEWACIINSKKLSIKVYKANWDTGEETYQETYNIEDFINKFGEQKVFNVAGKLYTKEQLKKFYEINILESANFGDDNPNKKIYFDKAQEFKKAYRGVK